MSLLVPFSILALTIHVRDKIIHKGIKRLPKGTVIQMARLVAAGPWWASACVVGTNILALHGELG